MFSVGQRVVLVGWGNRPEIIAAWVKVGANYPSVGEVYTVRTVAPWKDSAVLLLKEVDNSHLGNPLEPGFRQSFFRPAVERKTNISAFKEMLTPQGVDA